MSNASTSSKAILKQLINNYYTNAKRSEGKKLIAWSTALAPAELLYTMDIIPVYPENHGAAIGAQKMGSELAEAAEKNAYSNDLCSYARVCFGSIFTGRSPVNGLPRPNLLFCCNNSCATVTKWWENLSRFFKVPVVFIDTPFNQREGVSRASIEYISAQLREAISQLEQIAGREFDWDRFSEVAVISNQTSRLWREVIELNAHRPAPYTVFDAFNYMAPIVMMRGTQEALDFYRVLKESIEADITAGIAAVPGERYRILYDGIPMWFELKHHSELFRKHRMALVFSTYAYFWVLEFDPDNPLETMAEAYSKVGINSCLSTKFAKEQELIRNYNLDGVIRHSNRSCKPLAFTVYELQKLMVDRYGLPVLVVDGDQTDPRNYSQAQFEMRVEAFAEALAERSAGKLNYI